MRIQKIQIVLMFLFPFLPMYQKTQHVSIWKGFLLLSMDSTAPPEKKKRTPMVGNQIYSEAPCAVARWKMRCQRKPWYPEAREGYNHFLRRGGKRFGSCSKGWWFSDGTLMGPKPLILIKWCFRFWMMMMMMMMMMMIMMILWWFQVFTLENGCYIITIAIH